MRVYLVDCFEVAGLFQHFREVMDCYNKACCPRARSGRVIVIYIYGVESTVPYAHGLKEISVAKMLLQRFCAMTKRHDKK